MPQVANKEVADLAKVDNRRILKLKIAVYSLWRSRHRINYDLFRNLQITATPWKF
jgi:hypothetical protein